MILEKMSNFETTPDLLALQARVRQLEEALIAEMAGRGQG